jgi:hypothetical protein
MNEIALALLIFALSILAHLIVTGGVAAIGYWWGRRQGQRSYLAAKAEIREYVRTDLVPDITAGIGVAIKNEINGIFGPVAKAGTAEARSIAAQYAQENPGIMQLLTGVAAKAGVTWGLKQLGAPKEIREAFKITSSPFQFGGSQKQEANPISVTGPQVR